MKIYLAGNFPQMRTPRHELTVMNWATEIGSYNRLVTFYYLHGWTENVITAIKKRRKKEKRLLG